MKRTAGTGLSFKDSRERDMLGLLWSGECANRLDLSRQLKVSKVTVTHGVNRLIEKGLVAEGAAVPSQRGRRPIALSPARDAFYAVGISLFARDNKAVLVNACNETLAEASLDKAPPRMPERADFMVDVVMEMLTKEAVPMKKLAGIGMAIPGILDPAAGRVISSSAFPGDRDFMLSPVLEKGVGVPCRLINVSHLLAFIEGRWGKAKGMDNYLYFHSGYGLGMVLDGKLCRGSQCRAGEVGFMQLRENGEADSDGRHGTLGTIAPVYKITDRLDGIIAKNGDTLAAKYLPPGSKKVSLDMVVHAVEDGDKLCAQLMSETFSVIGEAILNLAYIFNPEAIFFEPWTARCPKVSVDIVRRMMGHYGVHDWRLSTEIMSADCGNEALAKGAALLPGLELLGLEL
jgi:predicted NBD/HSP70 family sugar kinase